MYNDELVVEKGDKMRQMAPAITEKILHKIHDNKLDNSPAYLFTLDDLFIP